MGIWRERWLVSARWCVTSIALDIRTWGAGPLGDVAKMKSGSVELLGTCIVSIHSSEVLLQNPKPGATRPVIESPSEFLCGLAQVTVSCPEKVMHMPSSVLIPRCSRTSESYPKYTQLFCQETPSSSRWPGAYLSRPGWLASKL